MGFFSRMFGKAESKSKQPEQAFVVTLQVSDSKFGGEEERNDIHGLTDKMEVAIDSAGVGEFDGDEFGDGTCTLYMYGPDADKLHQVVDSILKGSPLAKGAKGVKRYGEAADPAAREEIVEY